MHDTMTLAFEIKYPWRAYQKEKRLGDKFASTYRAPFITVWHVDPDLKGDDDSCGWFLRSRHGDPAVLARIIKRFESDWDRVWVSKPEDGDEDMDRPPKTYHCGLFMPNGKPRLSPIGITVDLMFWTAFEHFGNREKAYKFMQSHIFDIIHFAENATDSMFDAITMKFGSERSRQDRIENFASILYGWVLRESRPWWKHPRWHWWHWEIQVQPWRTLRRYLLTRCCKCGKGFAWGESPVTDQWDSPPLRFMRGETGLYHGDCNRPHGGGPVCGATAPSQAGTPARGL